MGSDNKLAADELQGRNVPPGPDNNKNGGPMCQFTDRFYSAVRTLAGDGAVKQRLLTAYKDHLELLPASDAPESIRERFDRLRLTMSQSKPIGKECAVVATVRKMSAADAAALATDFVAMFSELVRARSTGERVSASRTARHQDAHSARPANIALN